ncbi:outer membrane beta-barrel protein [Parapedobacter tibetensis]|uniref:outer membrane beta-barrel protein n=1 Tax=Parapedobacter tibetensis TaxID=2972951 RepID=UPI00214D5DFC|nr:outer membrane beta-barrel protein [Parapedobacter tibetensis]
MLFVFVFVSLQAMGQHQRKEISGVVIDTAGVPLEGVNVRLSSILDTILITTKKNGAFRFTDIIGPEFRLTFSMIGYKILDKSYQSNFSTPLIQLLPIVLPPEQTLLREVVINWVQPIVIKEDTIQYNMDAFNVRKNSLLEESLKLLPNVQVLRDGTVIAHGRQISRVQVDSKNFFGGEVLTATRNLPAEFVQSIQVIDYYGDMASRTGVKDTEPEKILNIVLKEDKKRILFGQVTGGGGTEERYIGSMGINNFNDGQEFSMVGSFNNTNTSLFSYGAPSGAGMRERGNTDLTGMMDPVDGLNTTNSAGVSYSDDISEKVSVYGKYTFSNRKNNTVGNTLLRSVYDDFNTIENRQKKEINADNINHLMAWDVEAQLDARNYLKVSPNLSYSTSNSMHRSRDTIENRHIISERAYFADEEMSSPNFDIDVLYSRMFRKPGRKFVLNMQGKYSKTNKLESINDYFESVNANTGQPIQDDVYALEQQVNSDNRNRVGRMRASYVEPIDKNSILEMSYEYNYTAIDSRRSVWDITEEMFVDSLSLDYSYFFESNKVGINYQMEQNKRFKYILGFAVQPLLLQGHTLDNDEHTQHSNINLIPSAGFRFRINDESEWSIDYLGTNNQPNFSQIQPIRDLTNSQNIIIGNADLKAEFINRFTTRFRQTKMGRNRFFEAQLSINQIQNKIVTNRSNPNSTIQETSFRNSPGYFDARGYFMYSTPVINDKFLLNLNGTTDYVNNISYVNDEKNFGRNFIYSQGAQVQFALEDILETELNSSYTFNRTRYSLRKTEDIDANSFLIGFAGKGYLSDNWAFGFDLSHRLNTGYSSFVNANPTLLNAYIECTFLKNNMALLRLQGFDLFNENTGLTLEVLDTDRFETRNNRLARYFMLSLNIRLQKYPPKKS